MPSPCVVIAAATAPNTPAGANHITKSVTFSITGTSSLMKVVTALAGSPFSDAIANPKKHENTRICRISLVAIASKKLRGNTWAMNSRRLSPPVLRFVAMSFSGSGRPRSRPGWNRFAKNMPSSSDTSEAVMNHSSALPPMRPTALASPMPVMPATTVANTSGAMIILISRRKTSERIEK